MVTGLGGFCFSSDLSQLNQAGNPICRCAALRLGSGRLAGGSLARTGKHGGACTSAPASVEGGGAGCLAVILASERGPRVFSGLIYAE